MENENNNVKVPVSFRTYVFQRDAWQREAEILNLSLTEFIIRKIEKPFSPVDDAQINEIKVSQINSESLIFEIYESCQESGTFTEEQFEEIMNALKNNSNKMDELFALAKKDIGINQNEQKMTMDKDSENNKENEDQSAQEQDSDDYFDDNGFWGSSYESEDENRKENEDQSAQEQDSNDYFNDDGFWGSSYESEDENRKENEDQPAREDDSNDYFDDNGFW